MRVSTDLNLNELAKKEFPRTWEVLERGLEDGVAPGFVAGLWRKKDPDEIWVAALGNRSVNSSSPSERQAVLPETVFDLASVSKVFATATLAAVLVERGWLSWNTPVCSVIQNYRHSDIRIWHLLSHTAGLTAWQPLWEMLKDTFAPLPLYAVPIEMRQSLMKRLVCSITPDAKPGEKCVYSDISFLLLGFVLEEITQMPLDHAVERFVWQPMGIQGAYYQRITHPPSRSSSVAATEQCPWRGGVLQGQVHDDNCWAMGGYGGHAGAFGSAREVLHFARGLRVGRVLSSEIIQQMWTRVPFPVGCERTLGWDTPSGQNSSQSSSQSSAGRFFSKHSVGHLGFTGTSLWIDPEADLAVVLLSNRVHPTRENQKIKAFRPLFHDAIRLDLSPELGKTVEYE